MNDGDGVLLAVVVLALWWAAMLLAVTRAGWLGAAVLVGGTVGVVALVAAMYADR